MEKKFKIKNSGQNPNSGHVCDFTKMAIILQNFEHLKSSFFFN